VSSHTTNIYGAAYSFCVEDVPSYGCRDLHQYWGEEHLCRYCGSTMRLLKKQNLRDQLPEKTDLVVTHKLLVCDSCGWWQLQEVQLEHDSYKTDSWYVERVILADSVVEHFDPSSVRTPVDILRKYLLLKFSGIREVHPRKLEEVIASVFHDFYDCDVRLTSTTRDGGYDIFAVISEKPVLVQVKRRGKSNSVEGVDTVRSLLGVMLVNGVPDGMVVSTADHFSAEAKQAVAMAALADRPHSVKLLDYSLIYDLFRKTDISDALVLAWVNSMFGKLWFRDRDSYGGA
jgi:hypothetical protein